VFFCLSHTANCTYPLSNFHFYSQGQNSSLRLVRKISLVAQLCILRRQIHWQLGKLRA
jgi:hypothetical protein